MHCPRSQPFAGPAADDDRVDVEGAGTDEDDATGGWPGGVGGVAALPHETSRRKASARGMLDDASGMRRCSLGA
jgi:hypothetical protein